MLTLYKKWGEELDNAFKLGHANNLKNLNFEMHYYKMWVQFIGPHSLDQLIHCFFTIPHSLQLMNSLKIQWNHLVYRDTFCCSDGF